MECNTCRSHAKSIIKISLLVLTFHLWPFIMPTDKQIQTLFHIFSSGRRLMYLYKVGYLALRLCPFSLQNHPWPNWASSFLPPVIWPCIKKGCKKVCLFSSKFWRFLVFSLFHHLKQVPTNHKMIGRTSWKHVLIVLNQFWKI